MDFSKLSKKAKDVIDQRGGMEALKEDAEELKDIAAGEGTLSDKAKAAAEAIKEPGAHEHGSAHEQAGTGAEAGGADHAFVPEQGGVPEQAQTAQPEESVPAEDESEQ